MRITEEGLNAVEDGAEILTPLTREQMRLRHHSQMTQCSEAEYTAYRDRHVALVNIYPLPTHTDGLSYVDCFGILRATSMRGYQTIAGWRDPFWMIDLPWGGNT